MSHHISNYLGGLSKTALFCRKYFQQPVLASKPSWGLSVRYSLYVHSHLYVCSDKNTSIERQTQQR